MEKVLSWTSINLEWLWASLCWGFYIFLVCMLWLFRTCSIATPSLQFHGIQKKKSKLLLISKCKLR